MSDKYKLTRRQEIFCQEYIKDLDPVRAAIASKYSEKSAQVQAYRILSNVRVASRIREIQNKVMDKTGISPEKILNLIYEIASADLSQAYNEDGSLKPIHEMPLAVRRCISSIDVEELFEGRGSDKTKVGYVKKMRFWDKTKGLEMLAKHLDLLNDKPQVNVDIKLALEDARNRVKDVISVDVRQIPDKPAIEATSQRIENKDTIE